MGEKSAQKLIKEFGSLESALDHAEKVTNKRVRNGLLDHKEDAILSKELVKIHTDVPLDFSVEDLGIKPFNISVLQSLFKEFEFHGLMRQFSGMEQEEETKKKKAEKSYTTVTSPDELNYFLSKIKEDKWLSIDLETTSVKTMEAEIVGLSFSIEQDSGIYIPIRHKDKSSQYFGENELEEVISLVKPFLENPRIPKTGQNVKYDVLILNRFGIQVKGIVFDTMIAAHLLQPGSRSYKLDKRSEEYLNYTMVPIDQLVGTGKNQISMAEVGLEDIAFYAVEDADIALQLTHVLKKRLEKENLWEFYSKVELPLIQVLTEMEYRGTYVQKELLDELSKEYLEQIELLVAEIHALSGTEFNVNSTQQLAQILFDILKLPTIRKRSTAEDVLERLKNDHPLPSKILEYRKLNKLKNTYLDPLAEFIHPETGRIHSSFNQTIAATGRLSSTNPNFQNIPIRTERGREIRKAFKAQKEGWEIMSADYSQIELRLLAHVADIKLLKEAFHNGADIHAATASEVFGIPVADLDSPTRNRAKAINFGIIYGISPFGLARQLGIPQGEAKTYIEAYFERYPGVRDYMEAKKEAARADGFVTTIFGRKVYVPGVNDKNPARRNFMERAAINAPLQGAAADIIKRAMIRMPAALKRSKLKAKMLLQVHDELIFEVPEAELDKTGDVVSKTMEAAAHLSVPLVCETGHGASWAEAH